jgi:hypothetical protein
LKVADDKGSHGDSGLDKWQTDADKQMRTHPILKDLDREYPDGAYLEMEHRKDEHSKAGIMPILLNWNKGNTCNGCE